MKISIDTASLKRALKDCARVAEYKTTIPVLSHVLIECLPEGVRLSVTDQKISRQEMLSYVKPPAVTLITDSPAPVWSVPEYWSRAVPVASLAKLLPAAKRVKASPVVILTPSESDDSEVRDDALYISVGGASTMLRALPAEDFPTLPFAAPRYAGTCHAKRSVVGTPPDPAVIPGETYRRTVRKIFSSISTEESRFQLSGAYFELNGRLRIGATDGHRLSRAETDYRVSPDNEDSAYLVPRKALDAMLKDAAFGPVKRPVKVGVYKAGKRKGEAKFKSVQSWSDVHLTHTEHHVHFETARGVRYVARILEGTYADADRVIQKETPELTITTDAENLRATMESISHMTGDRARAIRMELDGDLPVFSAANPDAGTSTAEMNGKTEMSGRMGIWHSAEDIEEYEALDADGKARADRMESALDRPESLGINPDYVTAAIAHLASPDQVILSLWDANSQMHVTGPDPSDITVIMPIRL